MTMDAEADIEKLVIVCPELALFVGMYIVSAELVSSGFSDKHRLAK